MDQAKLVELRSQLVMRIREAITPDEPVTEELQEATLQALCICAGSVFGAQKGIPVDIDPALVIGTAALEGIMKWHDQWLNRN